MNEKEKLYDTLLQLGTALREKRVHVYGVGWDLHKEKVEAVCEADKQYMDLPLTEEQKAVIERMLEKRMEANECELTYVHCWNPGWDFIPASCRFPRYVCGG